MKKKQIIKDLHKKIRKVEHLFLKINYLYEIKKKDKNNFIDFLEQEFIEEIEEINKILVVINQMLEELK